MQVFSVLIIILNSQNLNHSLLKKQEDSFFARDKVRHFAFCFFITNFLYQEMKYEFDKKENESITVSISVPLLLSFGKEFKDKKDYGLFSWKDIFWDIAGIIFASSLIIFY